MPELTHGQKVYLRSDSVGKCCGLIEAREDTDCRHPANYVAHVILSQHPDDQFWMRFCASHVRLSVRHGTIHCVYWLGQDGLSPSTVFKPRLPHQCPKPKEWSENDENYSALRSQITGQSSPGNSRSNGK